MAEIVTLLVIKVPSNTVTKKPTDYLNVDIDYDYRGAAQRVYFTAVVTQEKWPLEFDEIGSTKKVVYIDLPQSDTLRSFTTRVPNLPLSGVEPKADAYGVKVKAEGTFGTVEAGNKACLYVEMEVGISFQVSIWGIPGFGLYQKWWAYYWDPGINDFVDCGKWYYSSEKIPFSNVKPGGYLAVFVKRNSTVSPQYTSPTFIAVDGGTYVYDVNTGRIY